MIKLTLNFKINTLLLHSIDRETLLNFYKDQNDTDAVKIEMGINEIFTQTEFDIPPSSEVSS